jgi:hypothetical protein
LARVARGASYFFILATRASMIAMFFSTASM